MDATVISTINGLIKEIWSKEAKPWSKRVCYNMRARAAAGRNRATIQPVDTVSTWPAHNSSRARSCRSPPAAAPRPQRSTSITRLRRNRRSSLTSDSTIVKPRSRRRQCTFTLQASALLCASSPFLWQQCSCERAAAYADVARMLTRCAQAFMVDTCGA